MKYLAKSLKYVSISLAQPMLYEHLLVYIDRSFMILVTILYRSIEIAALNNNSYHNGATRSIILPESIFV